MPYVEIVKRETVENYTYILRGILVPIVILDAILKLKYTTRMKASYWQYEDTEKQSVVFRGRVFIYHGQRVETVPCSEVRRSKGRALLDAQKLMAELKKK